MSMTKKEAYAAIAKHVENAYAEIKKAEAIADEHGCEFGFELTYGMGGTYFPKSKPDSEDGDRWESSSEGWESSSEGWVSSSSQC